jgi:hypothetical protein
MAKNGVNHINEKKKSEKHKSIYLSLIYIYIKTCLNLCSHRYIRFKMKSKKKKKIQEEYIV